MTCNVCWCIRQIESYYLPDKQLGEIRISNKIDTQLYTVLYTCRYIVCNTMYTCISLDMKVQYIED